MKKWIFSLAALSMTFALAACGGEDPQSSDADSTPATHTHAGVKTEASEADCQNEGNIEYWTCECNKIFADEACENEITLADTVIAKTPHAGVKTEAAEAGCQKDGNIAYWTCECGKIFLDEACQSEITLSQTLIPATGEHKYDGSGVCDCGRDLTDKNLWIYASENCASVTYTDKKGWKASSANPTSTSAENKGKYYIKFTPEVINFYMQQGNDLMTIYFSGAFDGADYGSDSPLECNIWILPPNAADGGNDWTYPISCQRQSQLTKNDDGTYSHTISLINEFEGSKIHDFAKYGLTIYIDNVAANTGTPLGSIYIKDVEFTVTPKLEEVAKADYFKTSDGCESVVYTEGLGWKATAASGASHYYFKLKKEVMAYNIQEGYDTMTISFGSSFDGTQHAGRPTVCRMWMLPAKVSGGSDWEYKISLIYLLEAQMDGTYSWTIDLKDTKYDFVNSDFTFYVDTVDAGTGAYVGACYVYNVTFGKSAVEEEESYLGGVTLYQMSTKGQLSMGYIMVTEADEVIVLDGGRDVDGGDVYNQICTVKKEVDAWYLSHYHGDHIAALTTILNEYDITIKNLYFDFPTDEGLISQYGDGDNQYLYAFYDALEKNASKVKNIVTPKKGDVFKYHNLEIRVLNDSLFGEGMKYVNNSSVVYKAVTSDESVLFLGDMGDYGMKLLEDSYFKSEIETCTVIQMAHHGNSDLVGDFYSNIKDIKLCLFPCLAWVFNNDPGTGFNTGTYTSVKTRQYLESRGLTSAQMLTQVNGMVTVI